MRAPTPCGAVRHDGQISEQDGAIYREQYRKLRDVIRREAYLEMECDDGIQWRWNAMYDVWASPDSPDFSL
ncbi:unnamed protein product [Nippostrongylus brasiliensis]|uniref:Transposase n=1 Tax=Nippostrongylus brasiliensis TaxID=27835 RepID=A0A0N4YH01_NIPBR|nr:unnamed protein product [Nippostrongylus brasiliensis]